MKGRFITIEGSDGAGKTTQINMLEKYLRKEGFDVFITREPGGTAIGDKIREMLLDEKNSEMTPVTEALLYAASRAQHVAEKILPALSDGKTVICDRFLDSSIAYQGYGRGLGEEAVLRMNYDALGGLAPDFTVYLEISPDDGISRKKNDAKLDRMESQKSDFYRRVYKGYRSLYENEAGRILCLDARDSAENIHRRVVEGIRSIL